MPKLILKEFHFGKTLDLINFWDCPYYEDGIYSLVENEKNSDFTINGTAIFSEIYLFAKFLEKNNHKLKWTLHDYWSIMKNNFCIFFTPIQYCFEKKVKNTKMLRNSSNGSKLKAK